MRVESSARYRIVRKIGEGGMGTVFLGEDPLSGEKVALKFLSPSSVGSRAFFREEVRLLSRLSHPYLIKIFDYYESGEGRLSGLQENSPFAASPFFTMEYLEGAALHAVQLDPQGWIRLMVHVCEALSYLHARNILHRDLKPSNILLASDGRPKILDFGLSTRLEDSRAGIGARGTLSYMAPEAFWGESDFRGDLFSVGVLFYECLTGRLPFSAPLMKGAAPPPTPLQELRSDLPDFFSDLIHRLLELSPSKRPSSAASALRFLGQHQEVTLSERKNEDVFLTKTPWVGREDKFREFLGAVNFSSPLRVFLEGPTGVGRTRFLEELKWLYQLKGIPFFLILPPEAGEGFSASLQKAGFVADVVSTAEEVPGLGNILAKGGDMPRVLAFCDLHRWSDLHLKELAIFLRTAARVAPHLVGVLEMNTDLPTPLFLSMEEESVRKVRITLGDFSEAEGRELVRQAGWEDPPSDEEIRKILDASGKRPLLIVEALRQRLLKERDFRFGGNLNEISRRRIERLSPEAQELLALIVTHPRPVLFSETEALWVTSQSFLEDILLELDEAGFLALRSNERPELRLAQPSLGVVFREVLSNERGLEAHRRWVRFLEQSVKPSGPSPETILLAEHAWEAEDISRAKTYGMAAAEAEIARGNENAAITWYERLLKFAETPVERYTCHGLRAPLLYRQGRFAEALEAYDLWYRDRDDDETQLQKVKHCFFTGLVLFAAGREKEAKSRFEESIQTGDSERHEPLRYFHGRTLAFLATLEQKKGNLDSAEAHLLRGLKLAQGNPLLRGEIEQRLGELNQVSLRYGEALDHFERSLASYREAERPQAVAVALYAIALVHRECGRPQEALALMDEAVDLSRRNGQILQWARFLENRALIHMDSADYSRAFTDFEESGEVLEVLGTEADRLLSQIHRAELYLRLGNLDRAEKIFKGLSSRWKSLRELDLEHVALLKRAEGAYFYGDYDGAARFFEKALSLLEGKPPGLSHLIGRLGLCRSFARSGSLTERGDFVDSTLAYLVSVPQPPFQVWQIALRLLAKDPGDATVAQGFKDFIALIETHPWPETRFDLYGLIAAHFQRGDLHRTVLSLKQLGRSEWNNILQKLTEELKMDFEKNRDPDALDVALSESLPRPGKKIPEPVVAPPPETGSVLILSESRFRQYVEINRQLAQKHQLKDILERMMDAAIELTGAERGFLLLKEEKAASSPLPGFAVKTARNLSHHTLSQDEFKLSLSAVRQAVEKGTPLLTRDAQTDSRLHSKTSVMLYHIKSILVAPLEAEGEVIGVLYLDHRSHVDCFKNEDMAFLTAFASQAALALQRAKMIEDLKNARDKLEVQVEHQAGEILTLSKKLTRTREELRYGYEEIVGRSPGMMKVFDLLDHVTETTIPVWIHGESGTGKELVARSLHFNSPRKSGPFITENVSAIPETLLESELFGHKKGAFTHAERDRMGLFEQASGGTLFLDEVADMSLAMQAKLLRVLQEGEVRPLGSNKKVKVDVRLVTASNRDLNQLVREEKFRQDLFFRINGLTIHLPALRERREDIPLLVDYLIKKITREFHLKPAGLNEQALQRLLTHSWPGNIRELEGVLRNALLFAKGRSITPDLISFGASPVQESETRLPDREEVPTEERRLILEALRKTGMNKRLAAEEMGISLRSLYKRMERHGIPTHKPILAKFLGVKN
jgi:transcriptional regulator with GAF, ATPase, and Fis domain/tetratricopeptide (TPR) repeat protein